MAATDETVSVLEKDIEKLSVLESDSNKNDDDTKTGEIYEPHLWGFETRELYKIALNFYKGIRVYLITHRCHYLVFFCYYIVYN